MAHLPLLQGHPRTTLWGNGVVSPLSCAAYITWLAVLLQIMTAQTSALPTAREWAGLLALVAFIVLFATNAWTSSCGTGSDTTRSGNLLLQTACTLGTVLLLRKGAPAILLIVVAGQLPGLLTPRQRLAWLLAMNAALTAIWSTTLPLPQLLPSVLSLMGFQAFAMLTAHYAIRAEHARADLAQVNAELLATRDLLAQVSRDEERLRLSRELHDVSGHKLTALKLNLRAMAGKSASAAEDLRVVSLLTDQLLDDLRAVVGQMRRHDGIDLRRSLQALAVGMPGRQIDLQMPDDLRLPDLVAATALLRCAQEAVTNAIRHGDARHISIACRRDGDAFLLRVRDDGRATRLPHPGNGLQGMQERLQPLGGDLQIALADPHGLLLSVRLPLQHAQALHA